MLFKTEDVIIVADTLVEVAPEYEGAGTSYSGFDGVYCNLCDAEKEVSWDEVKHINECPYLIATDLLVRS